MITMNCDLEMCGRDVPENYVHLRVSPNGEYIFCDMTCLKLHFFGGTQEEAESKKRE